MMFRKEKITFLLLFAFLQTATFLAACSNDEQEPDIQYLKEMLSKKHPPNTNSQLAGLSQLRVLAIGNSYTQDNTIYIEKILKAVGVPEDSYCIYIAIASGASLAYWEQRYKQEAIDSLWRVGGALSIPVTKGTLHDLLQQDWDVIVMQQYSGGASDYNSYQPYLTTLATAARQLCTNKNMLLAWNLVHSYATGYSKKISNSELRWMCNALAASEVMECDGFDILIPTGTAIQNARNTTLNTSHELTRDGTHLAYGVGCYIAACTWAEALFSPAYGFSVVGSSSTIEQQPQERPKFADGWKPVTEQNRELCQRCAFNACLNPYELTLDSLGQGE